MRKTPNGPTDIGGPWALKAALRYLRSEERGLSSVPLMEEDIFASGGTETVNVIIETVDTIVGLPPIATAKSIFRVAKGPRFR